MNQFLKQFFSSIFVRIYAGLVILCLATAILIFFSLRGITDYRIQHYKENLATGPVQVIADGIARQDTLEKRQNWLNDAQYILNVDLKILPYDSTEFYQRENRRLNKGQAVIRLQKSDQHHDVYVKIPKSDLLLMVQLKPGNFREQMIKALPIFILDDLVHHPNDYDARLAQIRSYFSFTIAMNPIASVSLDDDQRARIKRREVVLMYGENTSRANASLIMVSPSMRPDQLLVIGPIPLFDLMPQRIITMLSLLALVIVLFGVYGLILPLHRKIVEMQKAVSQVTKGDLGARVKTVGHDEVAALGNNFNTMTEHIQRLIDAQQELTRAVSHELRTPVARIRFGLEMMADTADEKGRWEQQAQIDKDIQVLDELIDEILTYAKLDQGKPQLKWVKFSLSRLLSQINEETQALGKSIELQTKLGSKTVMVKGDYRYLHRVVQNLVGNALRYAKTTVRIEAGIRGNSAYVMVEDDGPGIPKSDFDKIFQPFARLDDSRTRTSGGYGLGLSIASKIAYWFSGEITVDASSNLGGAKFIMTWPLN